MKLKRFFFILLLTTQLFAVNNSQKSYIKLSKVSANFTYNRFLHKVSFIYKGNVVLVSPLSNFVVIGDKVLQISKPLILRNKDFYISKKIFKLSSIK